MSDYLIRAETTDDVAVISDLHDDAFGSGEPIAALVHRLRALDAALPTISLLAERKARVVGHLMMSHAWLDAPAKTIDVLVLSPLGVRPAHQGFGNGSALIARAIEVAGDKGAPLLFLEGSPKYYGSRGFKNATEMGFRRPSLRIPEPAFQVALLPGYTSDLVGTLVYRDVFWDLDCVGLR